MAKVEQTKNSITFYVKEGKNESTIIQRIDENGLTHIIHEIKRDNGKEIVIERKEWIF